MSEAWSRFGEGNGAANIETLLDLLSLHPTNPIGPRSLIGINIVDEVVWLDEPLEIARLEIHVAGRGLMRGRSLKLSEEMRIRQSA